MTVVNPKSISGITSITTASGSDDLLTIHTNNGTERLRIDSTGATKIVTGIVTTLTATTGIVTTLTANTVTSLGAVSGTTGTFSGALSGTIGTFSGALSGTTGTFTSNLAIGGNISIPDKIIHTDDTDTAIRFPSADTFSVETGGSQAFRVNSNGEFIMADASTKTFIDLETTGNNTRALLSVKGKTSGGGDVTLKIGAFGDTERGEIFTITNHDLGFATNNAAAQFKMKTGGNLEIVNGDLKVASGHGIDFSATSDGTTMTNELLDDYEEGTFTPTCESGGFNNWSTNVARYTKIGRLVNVSWEESFSGTGDGTILRIGGLPFVADDWTPGSMYAQTYSLEGSHLATAAVGSNTQWIKVITWGGEAVGNQFSGYSAWNITYTTSS